MDTPSIDDFDKKYTPDTSIVSVEMCPESQEGMFETFGEDIETVLKVANGDTPNRVWTAVDCDEGFYLINGYHLVNRVYYMITNEEGNPSGEDYLIDDYNCEFCGLDRIDCNEVFDGLEKGTKEYKAYMKEHNL